MQLKPGMDKGKKNENSTISSFKEGGVQEITSELSRCEGNHLTAKRAAGHTVTDGKNEEWK